MMPKQRDRLALLLLLCVFPAAVHAADKTVKAVPAAKVTSKNLPIPTTPEDTKKLEAILDKDEEAVTIVPNGVRVIASMSDSPAASATGEETIPAVLTQEDLEQYDSPSEEGFLQRNLTKIRIAAIRWRDAIEILFIAVIAIYVRKLYRLSREQQKILSHAIRSAEYAAASAKRSSEICESLLQEQKKPDEAQGRLDLGL